MRFLVDAQLPPALAWMLAKRGHIAEHVTDIGPADLPDRELWQYAIANDAVLITKDEGLRRPASDAGPVSRDRVDPHPEHPTPGAAVLV